MKRSFGHWLAGVGLAFGLGSPLSLASVDGWDSVEGLDPTQANYVGCKFALLQMSAVRTLDANVKVTAEKLADWQTRLEEAEAEYGKTRRWAISRFFNGETPEALSANSQADNARFLIGILNSYQNHFEQLKAFDDEATEFCDSHLDNGDDRMAEGSTHFRSLENLLGWAQEVAARYERDLEYLVFAFEDGAPSDVERNQLLSALRANESDINDLPGGLNEIRRLLGDMP